MQLLIPNAIDLATWAGVLFATLALLGLGRLLSAGAALPEAALIAGWGGAAVVLTLWGVLTPASLRWPAAVVVALGGIGLAWPRLRLSRAEWQGMLRLAVVALPLLALLLSARPSLPDTFLNLLPNAAYLHDHGSFPADARADAHSYLPAAPYNLQLAAFLAGLVTPGFPASAMIGLNLMLQLAAALLLARLVAGSEGEARAVPSWGATALGILLAFGLNPGFVPRYHLSSYDEAAVAVAVAFSGWLAARVLDRFASGRPAGRALWCLALVLAALVNLKQDSIALVLGILVAAAVLALVGARRRDADRGPSRRGMLLQLGLAAAPALVLYLAWRWYVLAHFALGELKPMPMAEWQLGALPLILWHLLGAVGEKIVYFGTLAVVFAGLFRRLRRRGLDAAARPAALLLGVCLLYTAALVFAYVADFPGVMGTDAHSFFRYETHLSLLLMVALVSLARATPALRRLVPSGRVRRFAPAALVLLALAAPLAFLPFLRFDLEVPQLRLWRLAAEAAPLLGERRRLALILPGDNGSVAAMLEGALRLTPPRHPEIVVTTLRRFDPTTLAALAGEGYEAALLSCAPPGVAGVPAGDAALLEGGASGWRPVAVWPWPPVRRRHWSKVLADAPLCLGG